LLPEIKLFFLYFSVSGTVTEGRKMTQSSISSIRPWSYIPPPGEKEIFRNAN